MTRKYTLRTYKSTGIHPRAFTTPKDSINIAYIKSELSKVVGWWNWDFREVTDNGVRDRADFKAAFGSGNELTADDAFRFSPNRSHRHLLTKRCIDRDNSHHDAMTATHVWEAKVCKATRAYEDQIVARIAAERAAKPRKERVVTAEDAMWTRLHETGQSGLGKAKRKEVA